MKKVVLISSVIALFFIGCSSKDVNYDVDHKTQQDNAKEVLKEL